MRWVWFRVAAAIAAFSGVVAGLLVNIDRGMREGQILGDVLANYFSLFTIVSSILSMVVLTVAARWTLRHPGTDDPSAHFRMLGEPFTAADWNRIEVKKGVLRDGTRAAAWVCSDGRVMVDWGVLSDTRE